MASASGSNLTEKKKLKVLVFEIAESQAVHTNAHVDVASHLSCYLNLYSSKCFSGAILTPIKHSCASVHV